MLPPNWSFDVKLANLANLANSVQALPHPSRSSIVCCCRQAHRSCQDHARGSCTSSQRALGPDARTSQASRNPPTDLTTVPTVARQPSGAQTAFTTSLLRERRHLIDITRCSNRTDMNKTYRPQALHKKYRPKYPSTTDSRDTIHSKTAVRDAPTFGAWLCD